MATIPVLYVAATATDAEEGAAALDRADDALVVDWAPATDTEIVRERAESVACVVFAETPTTAEGSTLLDVIDAAGSTPLILFSDSVYAPTAARSTDGIDGYVRRETPDAVAHLADEIRWRCHGDTAESDADDRQPLDRALEVASPLATATEPEAAADHATALALACDDVSASWLLEIDDESATASSTAGVPAATVDGWPLARRLARETLDADEPVAERVGDGEGPPDRDQDRSAEPSDAEERAGESAGDGLATEELRDGEPTGDELTLSEDATVVSVAVDDSLVFQAVADGDPPVDRVAAVASLLAGALDRIDRAARRRERLSALEADCERLAAERDRLADERDQLATDRDRLERDRDRLRALFEAVPEPAMRYALEEGRAVVAAVNEAFESTFGVDASAIRDEPIADVLGRPGVTDEAGGLTTTLQQGDGRQLVRRRETADGVRDFLITVAPLPGVDDRPGEPAAGADATEPFAGLLVYSDVTEARRTERELAAATDRLEEIGELVEAEARSPLNVARGYLELAEETGDREHFAEIETAHDQLRESLDQLAGLTGRDAVLVETEYVGLHETARRAWVAVETGDAGLELGRDAVFEADKPRLRELFEHLLTTATDCGTPADDGAPTVRVGATEDGFYVAGSAADAGGDPFAGQTAAADGTGLRLGLVERIADAHDWRVGIAESDDGTAFAFRGIDVDVRE